MLTENTGTHFLDSGMSNGRQWQRNQGKDFEKEPEVMLEFDRDGNFEYATVSVYHYLKQLLEKDAISRAVDKIIKTRDWHWTGEVSFDILRNSCDGIVRTIDEWNSYNWDSNISQILQGINIEINGDKYVLLQVHGGADARGGYTKVQCFKLKGFLSCNADIYGVVDGQGCSNMYDGYNITDDETNEPVEFNNTSEYSFDLYISHEF